LDLLVDQLKKLGEMLPDFEMPLTVFTPFGVLSRYDSGVPLTEAVRERYRRIVKELREFVTNRVAVLP